MTVVPTIDRNPKEEPDPRRTLWTAIAVLFMLVIAISGLCYTIHMLWTLPAKP